MQWHQAKKKKLLCCPHPTKIWKLGRSVGIFFFFLRTVRELSFPIFFLKFLNGENSGRMQSKRIYKSCKCFFKPLNTNFSKFFAEIWHKKKKKKTRPCFFAFYGRSGEGNINLFFFLPHRVLYKVSQKWLSSQTHCTSHSISVWFHSIFSFLTQATFLIFNSPYRIYANLT